MSDAWETAGVWLLRVAWGGGLLLLGVWALMRWTRQPARQQCLGEWGLTAALLAAALSLGPAWLVIPAPAWMDQISPQVPAGPPTLSENTAGLWAELSALTSVNRSGSESNIPENGPTRPTESRGEEGQSVSAPSAAGTVSSGSPFRGASRQPSSLPRWSGQGVRGAEGPLPEATSAARAGWRPVEIGPLLRWAATVWACGAALLLGRWLLGHVGLWRMLRQAESAPPAIVELLDGMVAGRRPPRLLVSHRVRVPLSCGLLRPTIILPIALCRPADAATLRWVFAHELTHLERRDTWTALLFALGQAVYYFLPWYWWLRRQVRLCQEYIADAAAVAQQRRPEDYAQFLLTLTAGPALPAGASGISGHCSDLFRRVSMLLKAPAAVERHCPRRCSAAMASGLLALAVIVSGIGLRPEVAASAARVSLSAPPKEAARDEPPQSRTEEKPSSPRSPARPPAFDLPNIDELLKRLPPDLDPEQREQIRRELERAREEMRKAIDRARMETKGVGPPRPTPVLSVRFPARPLREEERRLGVRLERPSEVLADQLNLPRRRGLVVGQVQPGSAAARAGIRPNDLLLEFGGEPVPGDHREFGRLLDKIKADTPVDVVVLRKGRKETIKGLSLPEVRPTPRPPLRLPVPPSQPGASPASKAGRNLLQTRAGQAIGATHSGDQFIAGPRQGNWLITLMETRADSTAHPGARNGPIRLPDGSEK